MAGNTEDLLDKLSELLQKAFSLPFGADRCIVDRDKVLGLLDEIREIMPPEIEQACQIVERSNDLINEAKREAAGIHRQAEERAIALVNENKIVLEARAKGREIEAQARGKASELKHLANDYVEQNIKRLDEVCTTTNEEYLRIYKEKQEEILRTQREMQEKIAAIQRELQEKIIANQREMMEEYQRTHRELQKARGEFQKQARSEEQYG